MIFALRYPIRSFLLCGKKRDGQTDKQTDRLLTGKKRNGQRDKQMDKQTDRATDRYYDIDRFRFPRVIS